jgi:mRNA interferase RelE/StbE
LKVEFRASFIKDLRKIKDTSIKRQVSGVISVVEHAKSLQEIENLKKLMGGKNYCRPRISDCRLGLILESDVLIFVRLLRRKEIYRYFP